MKKRYTLFILFFITSFVFAQNWQYLGGKIFITDKDPFNSEIAIDKSTNTIYICHQGYANELTHSPVISIHRYKNNQWDTLPHPVSFGINPGNGVDEITIYNFIIYFNDALYLFYLNFPNGLNIKKYQNNNWTDIATGVFSNYISNYVANENYILLQHFDEVFVLEKDDSYFVDTLVFKDKFKSIDVSTDGNDFYFLNYSYSKLINQQPVSTSFIEILKYSPVSRTASVAYRDTNNALTTYKTIQLNIINRFSEVWLAQQDRNVDQNSDFPNVITLKKLNNNQLQQQKIDTFSMRSGYNKFYVAASGDIVFNYISQGNLNSMVFSESQWIPLGQSDFYNGVVHVQNMVFDQQNYPYMLFLSYPQNKPVVMYLPKSISIEQFSKVKTSVFPNPSAGLYTIFFEEENLKSSYQVFSLDGKLIISQENGSHPTVIDLQSQPNGVYLLRIHVGGKDIVSKLLKQ